MPEFTVPTPQSSFSNPLPPTPQIPPISPLPLESKTNWFKIILLSLLGLAVVLGLVALAFWYGTQRSATITPSTETEETEEATAVEEPEEAEEPADVTADWEVVRLPSVPVTFKIPNGFGSRDYERKEVGQYYTRVSSDPTGLPEVLRASPTGYAMDVCYGCHTRSFEQEISYTESLYSSETLVKETLHLGGFDAVLLSGEFGPGPFVGERVFEVTLDLPAGEVVSVEYIPSSEAEFTEEIFRQVLSTFTLAK